MNLVHSQEVKLKHYQRDKLDKLEIEIEIQRDSIYALLHWFCCDVVFHLDDRIKYSSLLAA